MAIIATLIGGVIGFASFLIALLGFDATFATACIVYAMSGFIVTAVIIASALFPVRVPVGADEQDAQTA